MSYAQLQLRLLSPCKSRVLCAVITRTSRAGQLAAGIASDFQGDLRLVSGVRPVLKLLCSPSRDDDL